MCACKSRPKCPSRVMISKVIKANKLCLTRDGHQRKSFPPSIRLLTIMYDFIFWPEIMGRKHIVQLTGFDAYSLTFFYRQTYIQAPWESMSSLPPRSGQRHSMINLYNNIYAAELRVDFMLHSIILVSLKQDVFQTTSSIMTLPDSKLDGANMGTHLGPVGPRWGPMLAPWTLLSGIQLVSLVVYWRLQIEFVRTWHNVQFQMYETSLLFIHIGKSVDDDNKIFRRL